MGNYTVHPTGVTIYNPEKAWSGYTVMHLFEGAAVIDMNGRVIHVWKDLNGSPSRLLPGGYMMGNMNQPRISARFEKGGESSLPDLNAEELVEADWNGHITWRKNVSQHHDFQTEGNPIGYYVPGREEQRPEGHRMYVLANCFSEHEGSDKIFVDDEIAALNEKGEKDWSWKALDHLDDLVKTPEAKEVILREGGDWCHLNAVSVLGENRFFDAGDERFAPENLIVSARELSLIFIIRRADGAVIWRQGQEEVRARQEAARAAGMNRLPADDPDLIIGQHHAHMIPKGLPGEGNILLYDNGGFAGYGETSATSVNGVRTLLRHYSRILEIDPVTWKIVWKYQANELPITASNLFSPLLGSAQRLPNGNTMFTEGVFGRVMEVTKEGEIVWEYINDHPSPIEIMGARNILYRAYRVPYDYLPFLEKPEEIALAPVDCFKYRVPGAVNDDVHEEDVVSLS